MLGDLDPTPSGWRRASMVREWEVAVPLAAGLFRQNLTVWRLDSLVPADQGELDELSTRLEALAEASISATVSWGLRQVVFQRGS